jgi:hypothetical protein
MARNQVIGLSEWGVRNVIAFAGGYAGGGAGGQSLKKT